MAIQSFGTLVHWHPHLHVLLTDGAFRRGGTFLPAPPLDPAVLEEAWRRAVLAAFVREGGLAQEAATAMLAWPHSGFGAHLGPPIAGADREGLLRVARYGARTRPIPGVVEAGQHASLTGSPRPRRVKVAGLPDGIREARASA